VAAPGMGRLTPAPVRVATPSFQVVTKLKSDIGCTYVKWLQIRRTPEQDLQVELQARSLTEREGMLFRSCVMQQELIQQATHEIMRLELLVDDLQAQIASPQS